jgi:hypothetical protein
MHMQWNGDSHWFLQHETGVILDPVAIGLVAKKDMPDYAKAKGKGFLTKNPSKRTIQMMLALTYGIPFATNIEMNAEYHRGRREAGGGYTPGWAVDR